MTVGVVEWPRPAEGRLTIYALGPGFGESQVVFLPDRRCIVVDACVESGGVNLPEALLDRLGIGAIDLLAISHPDLDHIRGLARLVQRFQPRAIWRYPFATSLRTFIGRAVQGAPDNRRLTEFRDLISTLRSYERENRLCDVAAGYGDWPHDAFARGYAVTAIAPTMRDQAIEREKVEQLIERTSKGYSLARSAIDYLERRTRSIGDHPNTLSLALSIHWRDAGRRVLLGGDVEAGDGSSASGWPGVIDLLRQSGRIDRLRNVDVVKVAHHGSDNAFCDDAWKLHSEGRDRTLALVSPFNKSGTLPTAATLTRLRDYAHPLGITAVDAILGPRLTAAGWGVRTSDSLPEANTLLAVVIPREGPLQMYSGSLSAFHDAGSMPQSQNAPPP